MIRACDICGVKMNDYWMDSYSTGRTQLWLCPECRKNARREVDLSDAVRSRTRRKEDKRK